MVLHRSPAQTHATTTTRSTLLPTTQPVAAPELPDDCPRCINSPGTIKPRRCWQAQTKEMAINTTGHLVSCSCQMVYPDGSLCLPGHPQKASASSRPASVFTSKTTSQQTTRLFPTPTIQHQNPWQQWCHRVCNSQNSWHQETHHHRQDRQCTTSTTNGAAGNALTCAMSSALAAFAAAFIVLLGGPQPAAAHIPIDQRLQGPNYFIPPEANLGLKPGVVDRSLRWSGQPGYERSSTQPQQAASSTASRAKDALARLEAAHAAVDAGQYEVALSEYSYIVKNYEELALASYARTGQALMLYQVGRVSDALLALEDQEVLVRGTAEVHAALAALLWVERPNLAFRAEQQWEVAREFDKRYSDPTWVQQSKHWPPRAVIALQRFLTLTR